MSLDAVEERLRSALAGTSSLHLAVLFGSAARGTMRVDSDIDIGILPRDSEMPLAEELDLQLALCRVAGREVDLVRLDNAGTVLRFQIARDGRALFEAHPWAHSRFVAAAAAAYFDFAPALAIAQERFRRRLAASSGSSRS